MLSSRAHGRRVTLLVAGILFDVGVLLTSLGDALWVLVVGRLFLGFAVSFASVGVTLYNSEMALPHLRGFMNILYYVSMLPPTPFVQWPNGVYARTCSSACCLHAVLT